MARVKSNSSSDSKRKRRPAISTEARESQLISAAVDLAEKQLIEGTASSQVITHYLKLGTAKEKLEREKLEQEIEMLKAKTKAMESAEEVEKLYRDALNAMRNYSGQGDSDDY